MTIPAFAKPLGGRLPSADERIAANQLRKILAIHSSRGSTQKLELVDVNQQIAEVVLTPGLSQLLIELLRHVGSGKAVTLVPVSEMLTTQQAAKLLNVSRPTVVKLIDDGVLPARKVGSHRRVPLTDLLAFRQDVVARRRAALDEMTTDAEALGLYD